jgi:hypothetical protein
MSLARAPQQGKEQDAQGSLGEIYRSFDEGFETRDLKDAKELLDTLQ